MCVCIGQRGNWTTRGCKLESDNDGIITCSCTHLTNFAVILVSYNKLCCGIILLACPVTGCSFKTIRRIIGSKTYPFHYCDCRSRCFTPRTGIDCDYTASIQVIT